MRKAFVIAKKEYRSYLTGPMAYTILGITTFVISWMFFQMLAKFSRDAAFSMYGGRGGPSLNDYVFAGLFSNANVILLILVPAFTMRLFAEEKKNRTMDLLMTSSLTATEIVLGKFLGGLCIVWTIVAFLGVYPLVISFFANFDKGPVLTGLLGVFFMTGVYVAVGLFASSLTENAIIAYILALMMSLFLWVIGWASGSADGPTAQAVFNHLSVVTHFMNFIKGVVDSSSVVYYFTLMFFFCFLTHRVVESARWR